MHLKRKAILRNWPLVRKGTEKYVTKGTGPMPSKISVPMMVLLRDMMEVIHTGAEAKKILKAGEIMVDKKIVKDEKLRVGLFDRIYIKKMDKFFTLEFKNRKMSVIEIKKEEADKKPEKIIGKRNIDGKRIQINFYDGKNITVSLKDAENISVGDSALINCKEMKIDKILKLEKGANAFIIGGKHQGERGKITSIGKEIVIKNEKEIKASKQNIFVIEK